jgi:nucleoside-triphosphatase
MGIHPKIGITGLPRSGKSAVMEKVLEMLVDERTREINIRGNPSGKPIVGGLRTEPILENGERLGYKVINIITEEEGVIAHKTFDSRLRVLGYGLDLKALEEVAIPAINYAKEECEVLVIDEIGKFSVESENFVNCASGQANATDTTQEKSTPTFTRYSKKR